MVATRAVKIARIGVVAFMTTAACSVAAIIAAATLPTEMIGISRQVAETAALDVTRLALQVAILSIIGNVALVGILLRLATQWAQKPCVLQSAEVVKTLQKLVRQGEERR